VTTRSVSTIRGVDVRTVLELQNHLFLIKDSVEISMKTLFLSSRTHIKRSLELPTRSAYCLCCCCCLCPRILMFRGSLALYRFAHLSKTKYQDPCPLIREIQVPSLTRSKIPTRTAISLSHIYKTPLLSPFRIRSYY